jgi:broad specificity phosphatase PhoE
VAPDPDPPSAPSHPSQTSPRTGPLSAGHLALGTPRSSSTRLLLVRHGETAWNRQGRYQGSADVPLNATGRRQAKALAAQLSAERIAAVYSSTLRRAYDTAVPIAAAHGLTVVRDPRLNEINQGLWEGLRPAEIMQRWAALHDQWEREPLAVRLPEGDTLEEVKARVLAALDDILSAWGGQTVCIVAHKVSLAIIKSYALGLPLLDALRVMPPNASIEAVVAVSPPLESLAADRDPTRG